MINSDSHAPTLPHSHSPFPLPQRCTIYYSCSTVTMGSSSPYKSFSFTTFSPSDPIFAQLAPTSLPSLSNSIRRQTRTLRNRLRSIHTDAIFVRTVADAFDLPILTNSRAGDWYVDPERSAGAVYFKSTDGHYGEWKFSRRRLNFKVLEVAGKDGRGYV